MNQMERAKKIGISQGWFWKIYNGYAYPGKSVAGKLEKITGKPRRWWETSKLSTVQRVLDAIE